MNVLVINAGSSSLKFQLVRTDADRIAAHTDEKLARWQIERVGGEAVFTLRGRDGRPVKGSAPIRDLRAAVEYIVAWLASPESGPVIGAVGEIEAVGHRVVHGGERFQRSVRIDDDVMDGIEDMIDLAPLHNPSNLKGITAVRAVLGTDVPHVAVFDTAFHHTIPERAYLYAIPYQLYRRHKVRRYGFHGTSHRYVAYRWRELTGVSRDHTRIITLHLGNGCSACAIDGGNSVDTSMGFTPLEGLVMATRSGSVDPGMLLWLLQDGRLTHDALSDGLEHRSGLAGLAATADMREILEREDPDARLAVDAYVHRLRAGIAAMTAALGALDVLVFTGGVGENAASIRAEACAGLGFLGVAIDGQRNAAARGDADVGERGSDASVLVIAAREDLEIARQARELLRV